MARPRSTASRRTPHDPRARVVELVATTKGRTTTLTLRDVRSRRVLLECSARDVRGAELAMLTVERYCVERRLVLVMPANDTARASDGSRAA